MQFLFHFPLGVLKLGRGGPVYFAFKEYRKSVFRLNRFYLNIYKQHIINVNQRNIQILVYQKNLLFHSFEGKKQTNKLSPMDKITLLSKWPVKDNDILS